ncbi:hypothetical protein GGS24DRAFT_496161 [Hypoxylon argillaceum]|nr:hypothetical protein GGS24DRAFT_496161 [Hypoxylon argillaceum]
MDIPLPARTTTNTTAPSTYTSTSASATITTTTTTPLISGLVINSPSNLSCSSRPSPISTQNTSPDSISISPLPRNSSPLAGFLSQGMTVTGYITNEPIDKPNSMDNNSFQSVNDRRNKLASERLTGNQTQHAQRQHQQHQQHHQHQHQRQQQEQQQPASPQPQISRLGVQGQPGQYRGIASSNWRTHAAEDEIDSQSHTLFDTYDSARPPHHLQQPPFISNGLLSQPRLIHNHYLQHAVSGAAHPNSVPISDAQLDSSFAYFYDRGNGLYTRLIPADMLPALQNIPATQQDCAGMLLVPQPRALPPNGRSSNTEPVTLAKPPVMPTPPKDTIQIKIDDIVASTPPTLARPSSHSGGGPGPSYHAPAGQRRTKIYCDKWVHEGVCAFTQQGCKYKHEMPSDRFTQNQLGLFHGYPQWWKKHQADMARQHEVQPSEAAKNCSQSNNSRPSSERYIGRINSSAVGNGGARGEGSGFTSDASGQLTWRHDEYNGQPQVLGPAPSIGRATTSRQMCGPIRRTIGTSSSSNTPSYPALYGSPFGPIAPPARSSAATTFPIEPMHFSSAIQPTMEPYGTPQGTRRSSPAGTRASTSSMLPTDNPYATLEMLEDGGDQNTNDRGANAEAPRPGGARLS